MRYTRFTRRLYCGLAERRPTKALVQSVWPSMEVEVSGFRFRLSPGDNYSDKLALLNEDFSEPASVRALIDYCKAKRTLFLDVGANSGQFCIPIAASMPAGSRAIAFEPNPTMRERLSQNIALNGLQSRIEIEEHAISDKREAQILHLHDRNYGRSSLLGISDSSRSLQVNCKPLSEFLECRDQFEQVVVKIDVEGLEAKVLGPILKHARESELPNAVLLEVAHAHDWEDDLEQLFIQKKYREVFSGEGNKIFEREAS